MLNYKTKVNMKLINVLQTGCCLIREHFSYLAFANLYILLYIKGYILGHLILLVRPSVHHGVFELCFALFRALLQLW